jgi:predicted nucleic acid-binding Zn finger protein
MFIGNLHEILHGYLPKHLQKKAVALNKLWIDVKLTTYGSCCTNLMHINKGGKTCPHITKIVKYRVSAKKYLSPAISRSDQGSVISWG